MKTGICIHVSGEAEKTGRQIESDETYSDVRREELSHVEWLLKERTNSIENDENDARYHSVCGLQPLSVGFVRIAWVIAIVHGGLSFGSVSIQFDIFKPA